MSDSKSFHYSSAPFRYSALYKDGKWLAGELICDDRVILNESACVLQYAQTCFEGLKAYRTEDGHIVCFRPDMNAKRMADTCKRLEELREFTECGLCGTAAVIAPVGSIDYKGLKYRFNTSAGGFGNICYKLRQILIGVQHCNLPSPEGWIHIIE